MNTICGIVLKAVPIYLEGDGDDEDFEPLRFGDVTFYEISTVYISNDPIYGRGSIVVSGGLEYFSNTLPDRIHEAIILAKNKENNNLYLNN